MPRAATVFSPSGVIRQTTPSSLAPSRKTLVGPKSAARMSRGPMPACPRCVWTSAILRTLPSGSAIHTALSAPRKSRPSPLKVIPSAPENRVMKRSGVTGKLSASGGRSAAVAAPREGAQPASSAATAHATSGACGIRARRGARDPLTSPSLAARPPLRPRGSVRSTLDRDRFARHLGLRGDERGRLDGEQDAMGLLAEAEVHLVVALARDAYQRPRGAL